MITYKITFMDGLSTRFECQSYSDIADAYDTENIYKIERIILDDDLQKAIDLLKTNCSPRRGCEGCYFNRPGKPCGMFVTLEDCR